MCARTFSRRFLAVFLILFIACHSCFALAFLPSYSTQSEGEESGFMSLLRSMTSGKSEESSTPEGDKIVVDGETGEVVESPEGYVCYTEEEVEEMDKTLEKVEKDLADELDYFHFAFGPSVAWTNLTTFIPSLDMQFRFGDFIINGGVGYPLDFAGFNDNGIKALEPFDPKQIQTRIGMMYEF